jgi:protein-L-isoaspartate(D-aspartate) O-methyltransferase
MEDFAEARRLMVDSQLRSRGIADERVLEAMLRVPRDRFVPEAHRAEAYSDHPLPIGNGQTISQPYVVAVMLQMLQVAPNDVVLEVGAGSGYATAVLAELAKQVFSIERHETLAENARELIGALGYKNVEIFLGDGAQGLPEHAPFDGILVSAAAYHPPPTLFSQLREDGRMVIPVGDAESQHLQLIRMKGGRIEVSLREPVRFVPLVCGLHREGQD